MIGEWRVELEKEKQLVQWNLEITNFTVTAVKKIVRYTAEDFVM